MAFKDILDLVTNVNMTDAQREDMKRRLYARKQELQAAVDAVDKALEELNKGPGGTSSGG